MNSRKQHLNIFFVDCHVMCFPQECTGTRSPEVWPDFSLRCPMPGQLSCRNSTQATWRTGLEEKGDFLHKAGGVWSKITIIIHCQHSWARVSTLLRGVQHKRTENNCSAWGMYHAHDGSVQWNHCALWTGRLWAQVFWGVWAYHCGFGWGKGTGLSLQEMLCQLRSPEELCLFFDRCNSVSHISQNILSCKAPIRVKWPIWFRAAKAVCPSVAYLRTDRAGELSVRIHKSLFGLKILHWLNWVLLLQSTQSLCALLVCQDCNTVLWETSVMLAQAW